MSCFDYIWTVSRKRRFAVKTMLFPRVYETVLEKNENDLDFIGKILEFQRFMRDRHSCDQLTQ